MLNLRSWMVFAIVAHLTGCSSPTEPSPIPVQFESLLTGSIPPVVVSEEASRIRVTGGFAAGCGIVEAAATSGNNRIRIDVIIRPPVGACDAALHYYAYSASIDVRPGRYGVEVWHSGTFQSEGEILAMKRTVTVP